ncbi:MAG: DUF1858 domain-containing protein [Syntrophaceae bacterium]|nr:DUF1858 domain-containing protein [Syntrophaceae bacterium]
MVKYPAKNFLLEYKMIGGIVKEYPEMAVIMERYFGQDCLKKPGFRIKTLEMACILFGVEQDRLVQDLMKLQYVDRHE